MLINLPDYADLRDPFHVAALDPHDALEVAGMENDEVPEPAVSRL